MSNGRMHTFLKGLEDNMPHCYFWQLVAIDDNSMIGSALEKIERLGYRVEYVNGDTYLFAGNTGRIVAMYEWVASHYTQEMETK